MFRRLSVAVVSFLLATVPALAFQQPPAEPQSGFVPLDSMPPREQIPAAPLLLGSYAFFLVLMLFYLWTIWRRVNHVEKEMHDLERRQGAVKR
jgi:type VI protein secretion system component VasF